MEFSTLGKRAASALGVDDFASFEGEAPKISVPKPAANKKSADEAAVTTEAGGEPGLVTDAARYRAKIDSAGYELITGIKELKKIIADAYEIGHLGVHFEASSLEGTRADLLGIALCCSPGKAFYVPLGHSPGGLALTERPKQIAGKAALETLKEIFEDDSILKIGHNIKFGALLLLTRGIALRSIDDPMLMSYVKDAGLNGHGIEELSEIHLDHTAIARPDLLGKGRDKIVFSDVAIEEAKKIFRRAGRHRAAPSSAVETSACRGQAHHGLRNAGTTARYGPSGNGTCRNQSRSKFSCKTFK